MISDLPAFYKDKPIILWVEDHDTKAYLSSLWNDPDVGFRVAGGKEGVRPAVRNAMMEKIHHVFGLVDRDFEESNHSKWNDKQIRTFVMSRLEIENYTLDEVSLAGLDKNFNQKAVSSEEILKKWIDRASSTSEQYWMAMREVLSSLQREVSSDFPKHPKRNDIPDAIAACTYIQTQIVQSPWSAAARQAVESLGSLKEVIDELRQIYNRSLCTDRWRSVFSGKELFREVCSQICNNFGSIKQDFMRAIGIQQQKLKRQPKELMELLQVLRSRVC